MLDAWKLSFVNIGFEELQKQQREKEAMSYLLTGLCNPQDHKPINQESR